MKLETRDLKLGDSGRDAGRLKQEMRELGYAVTPSDVIDQVTVEAVRDFQQLHGLRPTGGVDAETARAVNAEVDGEIPRRFLVRGRVRDALSGRPFTAGSVAAFDRDMRDEQPLGDSALAADGSYQIRYSAEQFRRAEKQTADLRVAVVRAVNDARVVELASSAVIYGAGAVEVVDLEVGRKPRLSEWQRYLDELEPVAVIAVEGPAGEDETRPVALRELTDDDLDFLHRETRIDRRHLEYLRRADRFAAETAVTQGGERIPLVPPELFYGGLRTGLPASRAAWPLLPARTLRAAVQRAVDTAIVPAALGERLDELLEILRGQIDDWVLEPPPGDPRPVVGAILRTTRLSTGQSRALLKLAADHDGAPEDFWARARALPELADPRVIDDLQLTLQLSLLTGNSAPLVQSLKAGSGSDAAGATSLRDLTTLTAAEIEQKVAALPEAEQQKVLAGAPGETGEERRRHYARGFLDTLEAALPSAYLARGVARPPAIDLDLVRDLKSRNPGLDLAAPVSGDVDWGDADPETGRAALEAMRREIRAYPGFDPGPSLEPGQAFDNPVRHGIARFFANQPDFELVETHVDTYVAEHGETAFTGIDENDRDAVVAQLKLFQRLHRVAPRVEQMAALAGDGLHSALTVADVPRSAFVARFAEALGGEAAAERSYERAQQIAGTHTLLYAGAYQETYGLRPQAIHGAAAGVPDWQSLFGRVELCTCRHCRSVYSPAAYFVDLLELLAHSASREPSPLDVLLGRRPDLAHIPLTCDNTLVTLPYVDLVNEILEYWIVHGKLEPAAARDTAGVTAAEQSVGPQYTDPRAYETLQDAVYPPVLPFNRPLETVRAYLEHLGISRHQLITAFRTASGPADAALAAEALSLSPQAAAIVTGGTPIHELYGLPGGDGWFSGLAAVSELLRRTGTEYADLVELLGCRFVNPDRTLSLAPGTEGGDPCDLDDLVVGGLDAGVLDRIQRFIRLQRSLDLSIGDLDQLLAALTTGPIDGALDAEGILERLAQALGLRLQGRKLRVAELASLWRAIDTRGDGALYAQLFLNRAVLGRLDDAFALDDDGTELAVIGELASHLPAILAALRLDEADFEAIRASRGLAQLDLASLSTLHRHAVLARAQRLRVPDLIAFGELTGIDPFTPNDPAPTVAWIEALAEVRDARFSVAELGYLYRHLVAPERGLGASDDELRLLARHLGDQLLRIAADTEPGPDADGERTRTALAGLREPEVAERMMGLLTATGESRTALASAPGLGLPSAGDGKVFHAAGKLRVDGVLSAGEQALLFDLSGDAAFLNAVEALFEQGADGVAGAETELDDAPPLALPAAGGRLAFDAGAGVLRIAGPLTAGERSLLASLAAGQDYQDAIDNLYQQPRAFLHQSFSDLLDAGEAQSRLLDDPLPAADRFAWVLEPLLRHQRARDSRSLLIQTLAGRIRLEDRTTAFLLEQHLQLVAGDGVPLLDRFLARDAGQDPTQQQQAFAGTVSRLDKAALVVRKLELTPGLLAYLADHAADFDGFDLNRLPVDRLHPQAIDAAAPGRFRAWRRIYRLSAFLRDLPGDGDAVVDLFTAAAGGSAGELTAGVAALLSELTGWPPAEIEHLADADHGFALGDRDLATEIELPRLARCLAISRRLGVSTGELLAWARAEPDAHQPQAPADDVVNAAKARYGDEEWPKVAKPLNDRLRDRRRQALVAFVADDLGVAGTDPLFEHFLIDADMTSCMDTSRIKQAISSVQLFIQRCRMRLEPGVSPAAIDAERWQWMKNYRVWEANRKVFLYPENWVEPELRDDKTPLFQELESELLQGELTDEAAERALVHYLEKLEDVARLEIVAVHWQKREIILDLPGQGLGPAPAAEMRGDEILHVFGRTRNPPHRYYYRRLHLEQDRWTPWQAVDLDIPNDPEGVHLIPVVFNRRLHLFWPLFEERSSSWKETREFSQEIEWADMQDRMVEQAERMSPAYPIAEISIIRSSSNTQEVIERLSERDWIVGWKQNLIEAIEAMSEEFEFQAEITVVAGYWDVKLAWSELAGGGWTPQQTSAGFVRVARPAPGNADPRPLPSRRRVSFAAAASRHSLVIGVTLAPEPDPVATENGPDRAAVYGFFWMDGCRGQLNAAWAGYDARFHNPYESTLSYLSFEQDLDLDAALKVPQLRLRLPNPDEETAKDPSLTEAALPYEVLRKTPDRYRVVFPHAHRPLGPGTHLGDFHPFVYQDPQRSYCVVPWHDRSRQETAIRPLRTKESATLNALIKPPKTSYGLAVENRGVAVRSGNLGGFAAKPPEIEAEYVPSGTDKLRFSTFFHPHVCAWLRALNRAGIPALLTLANQRLSHDDAENVFKSLYDPTRLVDPVVPKENVDFRLDGAFADYNWEVFFHIPMLIADRLSQDQQFEGAQRWLHYVFDPTSRSTAPAPRRYWNVRPFYDNAHPERYQIARLLELLSNGYPALQRQVKQWRDNPFNPHLVARLRITAYQKNVVMKYLDNLIAWADRLFLRDSIESINEATQLYILAANILGPRPRQIPGPKVGARTYAELRQEVLDPFSNALVEMETDHFSSSWDADSSSATTGLEGSLGRTFFFCIPDNAKLLGYWDTVEDRLFKIRHCMNIEGVVRELPLFEPPIDPALLVRAAAQGIDISSLLDDLSAPIGPYRFPHVLRRALELCGEVKALGGALLQALEKQDAEALAALRAGHESGLLRAVTEVRKQQIKEATLSRQALEAGEEVTVRRLEYYSSLIAEDRIAEEDEQIDQLDVAQGFQLKSQRTDLAASIAGALAPQFTVDIPPSTPGASESWGLQNIMHVFHAVSRHFSSEGSIHSHQATLAGIEGRWVRRFQEWEQQFNLAERELQQVAKQIAAARIREQVTASELESHQLQIENAREIEDFLRGKYTDQELYSWMVSQTSQVFFQTYKLAYETAKRAERAYRFDLGLKDSSFVQFGHWDSLRKGLLAGEQLGLDLRRMVASYLEKNRRRYEITKHVSLVLHDPLALIALKQAGRCEVELPELLFDVDYPGHYFRRIKSISLSIPSVTGPYTSINCTLTLLSSRIRTEAGGEAYAEEVEEPDRRFLYNFTPIERIATSHGQNDSGMFELNFRDQRYLPFEGAGAVSRWRIEMPRDCNAFDFDTITDVVLTMSYTARDGGAVLAEKARDARRPLWELTGDNRPRPALQRLFSRRPEFPGEWSKFVSVASQDGHRLVFTLTSERFPYRFRGKDIEVDAIYLFVQLREEKPVYDGRFKLRVGSDPDVFSVPAESEEGENEGFYLLLNRPMPYANPEVDSPFDPRDGWLFTVDDVGNVEDMWMLLRYSVVIHPNGDPV